MAQAHGVEARALARDTDPEPTLSPAAVAGLRAAGVAWPDHEPRRPDRAELAAATAVVSFGPDVEDSVPGDVPYLWWRDVPAVSDGFDPARDAIVTRLDALVAAIDPAS